MTFIRNAWYFAAWNSELELQPPARSIGANSAMKVSGCSIDRGGVRARQIIAGLMNEAEA